MEFNEGELKKMAYKEDLSPENIEWLDSKKSLKQRIIEHFDIQYVAYDNCYIFNNKRISAISFYQSPAHEVERILKQTAPERIKELDEILEGVMKERPILTIINRA